MGSYEWRMTKREQEQELVHTFLWFLLPPAHLLCARYSPEPWVHAHDGGRRCTMRIIETIRL